MHQGAVAARIVVVAGGHHLDRRSGDGEFHLGQRRTQGNGIGGGGLLEVGVRQIRSQIRGLAVITQPGQIVGSFPVRLFRTKAPGAAQIGRQGLGGTGSGCVGPALTDKIVSGQGLEGPDGVGLVFHIHCEIPGKAVEITAGELIGVKTRSHIADHHHKGLGAIIVGSVRIAPCHGRQAGDDAAVVRVKGRCSAAFAGIIPKDLIKHLSDRISPVGALAVAEIGKPPVAIVRRVVGAVRIVVSDDLKFVDRINNAGGAGKHAGVRGHLISDGTDVFSQHPAGLVLQIRTGHESEIHFVGLAVGLQKPVGFDVAVGIGLALFRAQKPGHAHLHPDVVVPQQVIDIMRPQAVFPAFALSVAGALPPLVGRPPGPTGLAGLVAVGHPHQRRIGVTVFGGIADGNRRFGKRGQVADRRISRAGRIYLDPTVRILRDEGPFKDRFRIVVR